MILISLDKLNLIIKYKTNVIIIHIQLIQISYRMQLKHIRIHKAIAEKVKIVNYANQNSIHMAANKYGVETKSIILEKKSCRSY